MSDAQYSTSKSLTLEDALAGGAKQSFRERKDRSSFAHAT
jgi:hypothetical protein